jgi:hypothetical protein
MRQTVPNVEQVLMTGDFFDTRLYLYVPNNRQSWHDWQFRMSKGDGTVPAWSAANNFSSLEGTEPSFQQHATIFVDEWLQAKLGRELISTRPPPVGDEQPGTFENSKHEKKVLDIARAEISPQLAEPGAQATLTVVFEFQTEIARGDVQPSAQMFDPDTGTAVPVSLVETPNDADLAVRRVTFTGSLVAPGAEDTYRVDVQVPGKAVTPSF